MKRTILEFIEVFKSPSNIKLFTECTCYWFAVIMHTRFPDSTIVYDPDKVHFATRIEDSLYDITGMIYDTGYVDWEEYLLEADDVDIISRYCINLERR